MLHNVDLAYLLASLSSYPHTPYSPPIALSCSVELHVSPVCTQSPPLGTSPLCHFRRSASSVALSL